MVKHIPLLYYSFINIENIVHNIRRREVKSCNSISAWRIKVIQLMLVRVLVSLYRQVAPSYLGGSYHTHLRLNSTDNSQVLPICLTSARQRYNYRRGLDWWSETGVPDRPTDTISTHKFITPLLLLGWLMERPSAFYFTTLRGGNVVWHECFPSANSFGVG